MSTVNTVAVETPHGLRSFELCSGDVLTVPADLLVVSTHHNLTAPPTGKLVDALRKQLGVRVDTSQPWISYGDGITACRQEGGPGLPFRHLLTMRIARPRGQPDPDAFYDRAIRATFASVAALEFMGQPLRTISLPVLAGQRIVNYRAAVQSLLRHAFDWLRQSRFSELVRYFVYNPGGLRAWDEAMNASLGRSYVAAGNESLVRGLCREIVSRIDTQGLPAGLAEVGSSLRRALASPERLCVQTIAALGRKLAELVTERLCRSLGLPVQRDLIHNIEAVRKTGAAAEWIIAYLHSLRIFGNEGIHALAAKRDLAPLPSQLSSEDLGSILCATRALLSFWDVWQRQGSNRGEVPPAPEEA